MTSTVSALHALRAKVLLVALGSVVLSASHVAASNHDIQAITIPSVALMPHDRAPGPADRDLR